MFAANTQIKVWLGLGNYNTWLSLGKDRGVRNRVRSFNHNYS